MSRYDAFIDRSVARILSTLDRERASETYGCLDREHWGWKLRDFPLTMFQFALVPLARVWAEPDRSEFAGNGRLLEWIQAGLRRILSIQLPSGGFESVGPNAEDHGVTLAMVFTLADVADRLGDAVSPELAGEIDAAILRAAERGAELEEDYAFISNHQALIALAFQRAAERLERDEFAEISRRVVAEILAHQSEDGPFEEYGGADPGYETLGLTYLALLWERNGDEALLEAMRRSVQFLAHCVHPDGSLGGAYGSRHTHLYVPAGLEILAGAVPEASAIASYLGDRLALGNLVTPDNVDAENLPVLLFAYLEAGAHAGSETSDTGLPCERLRGRRDFSAVGIHAVGTDAYYGIVSSQKGGVCRFHDRDGRLLHQDAGWLLEGPRGRLSSAGLGLGAADPASDPEVLTCRARFSAVDLPMPTPFRYLLLRIAGLTVFRFTWLAGLIRRYFIGRLITNVSEAPFRLERKFRFGAAEVEIRDRVEATAERAITNAQLVREFTSIHMGSARYFHPSELVATTAGRDLHVELVANGAAEHALRVEAGPESGRERRAETNPTTGRHADDPRTEASR